jgi:hypothetical protein
MGTIVSKWGTGFKSLVCPRRSPPNLRQLRLNLLLEKLYQLPVRLQQRSLGLDLPLGKRKKADFHEGRCLAMMVEYGTVRARPDL